MCHQKRSTYVQASTPRNSKLLALAGMIAATLAGCAFDAASVEAGVDAEEHGPREEPVASATHALSAPLDTDSVKVTGDKVDFGGRVWGVQSPVGSGTMTWSVVNGFYTPRLTGTLHMKDADGEYARMHISYWDGGGNFIATRHGGIVQASGNGHQSWSVDLSPITLSQIVEAHVCTELSDDGVDFPQVSCETYILN